MKLILTLLSLAASCLIFAQDGKPATVVLTDGSTVNGKIDDKQWLSNPTTILFRKDGSPSFETFTPAQVKSIQIEGGDRYAGALVSIDNTTDEFEGPVFEHSLISSIEKNVFLLVQFSSPQITIYSLRFNNRMHLYYSAPDNPQPRELIFREYTVRKFEGIFREQDKTYISQLSYLTDNCPDMQQSLATLEYSTRAMIKFMEKYHKQCGSGSETYAHTVKESGKFFFSVLGGVIFSELSFTKSVNMTNYIGVITENPLKPTTSPSFGARLGYIIPRGHQKFNIVLDAYYGNVKSDVTEYVHNDAPNDYHLKTLDIDISYFHSSLGLSYFLTRQQMVRPFVQAGFVYSKILSEKSEVRREIANFGPVTYSTESPFPKHSLKTASSYLFFGGGLRIAKFGIEFKYMPMGSLTRFSLISSSMDSYGVFLSYKIN